MLERSNQMIRGVPGNQLYRTKNDHQQTLIPSPNDVQFPPKWSTVKHFR